MSIMSVEQSVSREAFIRGFFSFFKELMEPTFGNGKFTLLPPGAESETSYSADCTECYECVAACPHQSLRICRERQSPFWGKPIIVPRENPCYLCSDFPCVTQCSAKALTPEHAAKLNGVAQIDIQRCLAFNGNFCRSCVTNCPETDKALSVDEFGRPVVASEKCKGCGICEYVCPAEKAAIFVSYPQTGG